MRILTPLASCALLLTTAAVEAQSLRTVTNKKQGFKVKVPRFVAETPTQPGENQIIAKFKGKKKVKAPPGYRDRRTGKRLKFVDVGLEVWVFRIANPSTGAKAVITPGRKDGKKSKTTEDVKDRISRLKNSGRTVKDFLRRRVRTTMSEAPPARPWKDRNKNVFDVLKSTGDPAFVQCFSVTHKDEHFGHEVLGMVWLSQRMIEFEKLIEPCVKSLRRIEPEAPVAKADPYEGSELRSIEKRRQIRARLVKGWYAEDTENFILVTDMPSNTANRQLLKDMLIDLEVMRSEYEKRFPPVKPFDIVCTVRVCNSYQGYINYSAKPGTGGYWHPIKEELVLFNPVGKIKKQAWMKRVTPKAILYHEAMHQYFHYANGEMPPASWFNEGYGEYFGGAKTDRYQKKIMSIGKNDFRWQVIKKAKKDKKWPLIKKMLPMTQQQFYSRKSKDYPVLNNYAFAWAFCYFLEQERNKRDGKGNQEWAAIPDNYLKNLRKATTDFLRGKQIPKGTAFRFAIPIQKRAYELTFKNTDFDKLQADWVAAMKSW